MAEHYNPYESVPRLVARPGFARRIGGAAERYAHDWFNTWESAVVGGMPPAAHALVEQVEAMTGASAAVLAEAEAILGAEVERLLPVKLAPRALLRRLERRL